MEPTTYKAVWIDALGYWFIQSYTGGREDHVMDLDLPSTSDDLPRRIAALLNIGGHLSTEALESGRFELTQRELAGA